MRGSPVDALPLARKMAASTNGDARSYGKFHPKCGRNVTLSENRQIASGIFGLGVFPIAFSNDPIPEGLKFSVKILQNSRSVSTVFRSVHPQTWLHTLSFSKDFTARLSCKSDEYILQTSHIRCTLHGWRCCACSPLLPMLCTKCLLVPIACHRCLQQ